MSLRMCHRDGCYNYSDRAVCDDCRTRQVCQHGGCGWHALIGSSWCSRHGRGDGAVKLMGRWRTLDECKKRLAKNPALKGATWTLETEQRTVPVKGVDSEGRVVDTGTRQTLERKVWVARLGTFEARIKAEVDERVVTETLDGDEARRFASLEMAGGDS